MPPSLIEVAERDGLSPEKMVDHVVVIFEANQFGFEVVTKVNEDQGTHDVRSVFGGETRTFKNTEKRYY